MKKHGGGRGRTMCTTGEDAVVNSTGDRPKNPYEKKPKKPGRFSNLRDWLDGKSSEPVRPKLRKASSATNSPAAHRYQSSGPSIMLPKPCAPPGADSHRKYSASSSSYGDRSNGNRDSEGYQIRAPPPGSYQDDDTGPSPKNLLMAVMGVKSAVNHFAKVLIADMNKHLVELEYLKQTIIREVPGGVDRANHWKFLVQAFICKRLFDGFDAPNGYFGVEFFQNDQMTTLNSFADFSSFKDKAATISRLLESDAPDGSFLGRYCFQKFKSISGEVAHDQPLPIYREEWNVVGKERHPKTVFYQSFLKAAVSVWLLQRLAQSFDQRVEMLTYEEGTKFQRKNMESVVPGSYEEEDEENDVSTEVGFLVIPGFQVSRSVVKCEVYLRNQNRRTDAEVSERASAEKIPGQGSSYKTPVKTLSNKTGVSPPTAEMPVRSKNYPGSVPASEGYGSFMNFDHVPPRVGDAVSSGPVFRETVVHRDVHREGLSPGKQGTGSRSEWNNKYDGEGFRDAFAGGPNVSVYKIAAPPSRNPRGPLHVARDTKLSEMRRKANSRPSPSG